MTITSPAPRPDIRDDGPGTLTGSPTARGSLGRDDLRLVVRHRKPHPVTAGGVAPSSPRAGTWSMPVPCVAHPCAGLVHVDGPCQCFVGGPAPVHGGVMAPASWAR
jgi:hypothetical protein